jgi:hypothetical protein
MRKKLANWTRLAVVVVVVAGTQTGCKSGWKMPGSDLFSWSKKPSESTLAGSSPSLSMPSSTATGPVSPAQRNTPSAIGSTAGNRTSNPYGATSPAGPSFNMPPNNAMAMGGAGTAAAANGYTNGPYGMVSSQAKPNGYTAPSGYGAPTGYGAPPTGLAANAPAGFKPSGYAPTSNALASTPSLPPAYGGSPAPSGALPAMPSGYPSFPNNSVPAMPAAYNSGPTMAAQSLPPIQSSMPNAVPAGFQPTMPAVATQSYGGASTYRPGSVARTTGYDFSTQGPGAVANTNAPAPTSLGLPPAVPSTANSMPNAMPNQMYR